MPRDPWREDLAELRRDSRSGAAEIEQRATQLLLNVVAGSYPTDAASYRRWLVRSGRELIATQPAMGALFRLVNDLLWACDGIESGEQLRVKALAFLQERQLQTEIALKHLSRHAAEWLAPLPAVMTYSRSSTVLRALKAVAATRQRIRVYCGEGRPMLEGQTLANELAWAGLKVTLGIDMALFGWLGEVKALLIGADALSATGLVNKVGTTALVAAAAERDIPRVALCSTFKFLPTEFQLGQGLRAGDPSEVMPVSSDNIVVRNPYFEVVPLESISLVITERGPLERPALLEALGQVQTYLGLREM